MKSIKLHETYSAYKDGELKLKTTDMVHLDTFLLLQGEHEVRITWEIKNKKHVRGYQSNVR